jgi:hypothetical protein
MDFLRFLVRFTRSAEMPSGLTDITLDAFLKRIETISSELLIFLG